MLCEKRIGTELGMLKNLLERQLACMRSANEEEDLTGMQAMLLHHLLGCEGDCFQKDLETQFRIRRSTATGMLKLMEQRGLISREPVEYDARLKKLVLTDKARKLDKSIRREIQNIEAVMSKSIDPNELEIWFKVCGQIQLNLEQYQSKSEGKQ